MCPFLGVPINLRSSHTPSCSFIENPCLQQSLLIILVLEFFFPVPTILLSCFFFYFAHFPWRSSGDSSETSTGLLRAESSTMSFYLGIPGGIYQCFASFCPPVSPRNTPISQLLHLSWSAAWPCRQSQGWALNSPHLCVQGAKSQPLPACRCCCCLTQHIRSFPESLAKV